MTDVRTPDQRTARDPNCICGETTVDEWCPVCVPHRHAAHRPSKTDLYSKPEVLLGDLRRGVCSSGLCRQLRAVAADEIERLMRERDEAREHTSTAAFMRLEAERDRLRGFAERFLRWTSCHCGDLAALAREALDGAPYDDNAI